MIILHAGVLDGKLLLWAETNIKKPDTITVKKPRQKSNPRTGSAAPPPFDYDAGAEKLLASLEEIGLDLKIHKRSLQAMTIWLPTVDNRPVPSSALIAEPPESVATATLTPWKVTVVRMPLEKPVEFLCRCVGRQTLGQGIIVGNDLSFWATAMRFAGALVAKQQFLPDVGEVDGVYFACWKPVFMGVDNERFSRLVRAMPAVGRALTYRASSPPDIHPISILSAFTNVIVDQIVRSSITAEFKPIPARERKLSKKHTAYDSIHDQRLHALRSPNVVMEADATQLRHLTTHVKEWVRPISISPHTPLLLS